MFKPRLYLDTSVASAYFDTRAPDRQRHTRQFWSEDLPRFEALISDLVLQEVERLPDSGRRAEVAGLLSGMEALPITHEAQELAREYVKSDIVAVRYMADALHVAVAVTHGVSYMASWNFKHLVRVATRRQVNLVNAHLGYGPIEILAPPEL